MRTIGNIMCLALTLGTQSAFANFVSNPSFETFTGIFGGDGGAQLLSTSTALTDWSIVNGEIAILRDPNSYGLAPSDGNNFLDLAGYSNTGLPKGISQTLNGLSIGQVYRLTLDLGIRNGACVFGGNNCTGPIQAAATIGSSSQTFTHDSADAGNIWGTYGFDFTASDAAMTLTLRGISLPAGNQYIGLDNISVEEVPLPGAALMFGTGLIAALTRSRNKRGFSKQIGAA